MSTSKQFLRYAGDVNIDKMIITSAPTGVYQDITGQMLRIEIFEDIFSTFIHGTVTLKESHDFMNLFPLVGEEYLDIKITTPTIPGGQIAGKFHIYKMTDKVKTGDKVQMYELHFVSIEALSDLNKKISKVYSGRISDLIAPFIVDPHDGIESTKNTIVENTRNSIKYISNFWSPIKNLKFLADNAISSTQSPSFLFFENRNGFNFVSLERLYKNPSIIEFTKDNYTRDTVPLGGNALNPMEDYKRIGAMTIPTAYNYMDKIRSGQLASRLVSYDSTKKTYTVRNYSSLSRFGSQIHLNPYPTFSDKAPVRVAAKQIIYNRAFETFTSFGDTTNAKIVQERQAFLAMAESQKIVITVPGRADYTVGQCVDVLLYRDRPVDKKQNQDEMKDKMYSGKYLIAAINHTIGTDGHECSMELVKDSIIRSLK